MNNSIRNRILACILAFALVSLACGIHLKRPVTKIEIGPTQTVDIQIPMPEEPSTGVELKLDFVAGELKLAPGADGKLASGIATFNAADFEPRVEASGSTHLIRTGDMQIKGIPVFEDDLKNEWDLRLADMPMSLNIQAGAYSGDFELGGLSLENLAISEGGSDLTAAFSEPNRVEMSTFTFYTGGSSVELKGLANANFGQMIFSSGAGEYTLSFDGDLQRDASVKIDSGVGTLTVIVPEEVNAQVDFDGGLTTVNADGGWVQNGSDYSLSASGPILTIKISMGAGTLNLKTE